MLELPEELTTMLVEATQVGSHQVPHDERRGFR
jgi:hypothetical protein